MSVIDAPNARVGRVQTDLVVGQCQRELSDIKLQAVKEPLVVGNIICYVLGADVIAGCCARRSVCY